MQLLKSKLIWSTVAASLLSISQPQLGASQDNPATTPTEVTQRPTPQTKAKSEESKPTTLKSKEQRQRDRQDVFKPSEEISEDFAAPLPVDI